MSGFIRSFYFLIDSKFGNDDEHDDDMLKKEKESVHMNGDRNAPCVTPVGIMNNALFKKSALMKYGDQNKSITIMGTAKDTPKTFDISQYMEPNILVLPTIVTENISEKEADVQHEVAPLMPQQQENKSSNSYYYFDNPSDDMIKEQSVKEEITSTNSESNLQSKASEYICSRNGMKTYIESKIEKPTLVLKKPLKELYNNFSNCSRYSTTKGSFFNFKKKYSALQAPKITGRAFELVDMPSQFDSFFD